MSQRRVTPQTGMPPSSMIRISQLAVSPAGPEFTRLLDCSLAVGGVFFGAISEGVDREDAVVFRELDRFLISDEHVSRYPGTSARRPKFRQRIYSFTDETKSIIYSIEPNLYEWDHRKKLPTDPHILMPNSRTLVSSITSEDCCFAHLTDEQRLRWLDIWPNSLKPAHACYEESVYHYEDLQMDLTPVEHLLVDGFEVEALPPEVVAALHPEYANEEVVVSRTYFLSVIPGCIELLAHLHETGLARVGYFDRYSPGRFVDFDLQYIRSTLRDEWVDHVKNHPDPYYYVGFLVMPTSLGRSVAERALLRQAR